MHKHSPFGFLVLCALLLAACVPAAVLEPTRTATTAPSSTLVEVTASAATEPSPTAEPVPERVVIDMSQAILEHPITPEAVDQFPLNHEDGLGTVYFTFDNWVFGPVQLAGDYEMIVGAEGWIEQDGQQQAFLIPIAVRNRTTNQMQINRFKVQDFMQAFYEAEEGFWTGQTGLSPGNTLSVTLGVPTEEWANNSTQGFGFEAAQFTEEELHQFFETSNFSILGNLLWPAVQIAVWGR